MSRLQKHQLLALAAHQRLGLPPEGFVMPPPLPRKKRDNEEWRIQSDFFLWWRQSAKGLGVWPGLFFHIPNGSMLGDTKQGRIIRAKMLKSAGVVGGVVDCFLAVPAKRDQLPAGSPWPATQAVWAHGCYIEFKKPSLRTAKNGGLSGAQQEFLGYALARGYACHVCYSWKEAREVTLKYLSSPNSRHEPDGGKAAPKSL